MNHADVSDPIDRCLHLCCVTEDGAAALTVQGIQSEVFLILPHPEVAELFATTNDEADRWLH